jgi:CubicO group peptidase (beta-lactamase class C family)
MSQGPGAQFRYNSGGSHLLSAIIWQTTHRQPLEFAQDNLFRPMGVSEVYWLSDPTGLNFGGSGLELTLPDMAKFGYLYLQFVTLQETKVLTRANQAGQGGGWKGKEKGKSQPG